MCARNALRCSVSAPHSASSPAQGPFTAHDGPLPAARPAGHQVHGNALAVLESMPMGTILSLLGQVRGREWRETGLNWGCV